MDTGAENESGGWDIDSAGHTAVGLVWNVCNAEAFLWTDAGGAGGFVALDSARRRRLPRSTRSPPINRATVISDDGLTIGGFASDVCRRRRQRPTGSTAGPPSGPPTAPAA